MESVENDNRDMDHDVKKRDFRKKQ